MANSHRRTLQMQDKCPDLQHTGPDLETPPPPHVPQGRDWDAVGRRWAMLNAPESARSALGVADARWDVPTPEMIENFLGWVAVPVGLAGPLRVNGTNAKGDFYIPLATVEPTLVASYSRGSQVITGSGGCSVALLDEGVMRAPGFEFRTLAEAVEFSRWASREFESLKQAAEKTTRFGKLLDMKAQVFGRTVILVFEYATGDAMGQNMVTIATDAVLRDILARCPIKPVYFSIEANMSGDKKACFQSFQSVRGRKVSAEVVVPRSLCREALNAWPESLNTYNDLGWLGAVASGTIGVQGHVANGLTALYLACGQDAACASESSVGITYTRVTEQGDLYCAVTLPNIMVGTVGAVSKLESQRACLELLGMHGPGMAPRFAELAAAVCLAGELSIMAALSCNEFTRAHEKLARGATNRSLHAAS